MTGDSSRVATAAAVGALVGGLAAYLAFTAHGRQVRTQLPLALNDLAEVLRECRRAIREARQVTREASGVADDIRAVITGADLPADV